jgi:hypothetical protein
MPSTADHPCSLHWSSIPWTLTSNFSGPSILDSEQLFVVPGRQKEDNQYCAGWCHEYAAPRSITARCKQDPGRNGSGGNHCRMNKLSGLSGTINRRIGWMYRNQPVTQPGMCAQMCQLYCTTLFQPHVTTEWDAPHTPNENPIKHASLKSFRVPIRWIRTTIRSLHELQNIQNIRSKPHSKQLSVSRFSSGWQDSTWLKVVGGISWSAFWRLLPPTWTPHSLTLLNTPRFNSQVVSHWRLSSPTVSKMVV